MTTNNLSQFICTKPFTSVEFHDQGEVFFCCPQWLDISIGNTNKETFNEVWNSNKAQDIRESILDGSYKYCNKKTCPYIQGNTLKKKEDVDLKTLQLKSPNYLMLNIDQSCNLSCPSCRTKLIINAADSPQSIEAQKNIELVKDMILKCGPKNELVINLTGSGDPLASNIYRQFLLGLDGNKFPHLKIELQTNGVLLTPEYWQKLFHIQKNISNIYISIDAASEATYQIVRRGGDFEILWKNISSLVQHKRKHKNFILHARFVVQEKNYLEMNSFAKKCIDYGFDVVEFSKIENWGTWNEIEFKKQQVWNEDNIVFENFLMEISRPGLNHARVFLGNLQNKLETGIIYKKKNLGFFKACEYSFQYSIASFKKTLLIKLFEIKKATRRWPIF